MLRIRRPQISRHVIARPPLLLPLVLHLVHVRIQRRQLRRADQHFLLASRRVHVPQLTLLSLFIALHNLELRPVRTPPPRLGRAPRQSSRLIHRFNGERLGGRSLRLRPPGSGDAEDKNNHGKPGDETNLSFQEATSQVRNNSGFPTRERTSVHCPAFWRTGPPSRLVAQFDSPTAVFLAALRESLALFAGMFFKTLSAEGRSKNQPSPPPKISAPAPQSPPHYMLESIHSMLPDIENLLRLQDTDKEIRRLQDEVAEFPKRVAVIEQKLAGTKAFKRTY